MHKLLKVLEILPMVVFFVLYKCFDIFTATIGIVITAVLVAVFTYFQTKKVSKFSLANLVFLVSLGSLTLLFNDTSFIKMKPSFIYFSAAVFLTVDLVALKKFYVKKIYAVISDQKNVKNVTWKNFTIHWIALLTSIAILNELTWRYIGENAWVNFKVFFVPVLLMSMLFTHAMILSKKE
jgi:intracellular septation protein